MALTNTWNTPANDGDSAYALELVEAPEGDCFPEFTPRYRFDLRFDRALRWHVARLLRLVAGEWRVLDEAIVGAGEYEPQANDFVSSPIPTVRAMLQSPAVRRLRESRWAARGLRGAL